MFTQETRFVVYIAVSLVLLASLFTFIGYLIDLRNDFAEIRNNEILTTYQLKSYREFDKYNNRIVYGEDVIEVIREYYDTDIEIYVNDTGTGYINYRVNKELAESNPDLVDISKLQDIFVPEVKFQAILVYDKRDPSTITKPEDNKTTYDITGIAFRYAGRR